MFSLSLILLRSCLPGSGYAWFRNYDTEAYGDMPMNVSSLRLYNKANIFLVLIEYELNSLLGAVHFVVDYISVHIRFDLERYLLNIYNYNFHLTRKTYLPQARKGKKSTTTRPKTMVETKEKRTGEKTHPERNY